MPVSVSKEQKDKKEDDIYQVLEHVPDGAEQVDNQRGHRDFL